MVRTVVVLLVGFPAWGAIDDSKDKPKPATPAQQYVALVKEYDKAMKEYRALISQATTDKDRRKAFEKYPQPDNDTSRMLNLAANNPKDSAAVDALVSILRHFRVQCSKVCA